MFKEDDYSKKIKDLAEEIENLKKTSPELNYIDCARLAQRTIDKRLKKQDLNNNVFTR